MVDHQFGGVIQISVEEDTRGESSESCMGGSQSVLTSLADVHWTERRLSRQGKCSMRSMSFPTMEMMKSGRADWGGGLARIFVFAVFTVRPKYE